MLKLLKLKGTIVTADALNCQRTIAQQIVNGGGNFCVTLKGNQGTLHDDVRRYFDDPASETVTMKPVIDDHGRIESRMATVTAAIGWLDHHGWPGLKAIGKVLRRREIGDKTSTETSYYLLSAALSPERLNEVARLHWGIENRLHGGSTSS